MKLNLKTIASCLLGIGTTFAFAGNGSVNPDGTVGLPYFEDFETEDHIDLLSVIDANNDGRTWFYSDIICDIRNRASEEVDADDWILLPPMNMKANESYRLSFNARAVYPEYPERLEVKIGEGKTPDGPDMTIPLIPPTDIVARRDMGVTVTVPKDGIYRIGFHAISDKGAFRLAIDDIKVDAPRSALRPGVPTEANLEPVAPGSLSCNLSFKTPSLTVNGEPLSSLSGITVMREGSVVRNITDVLPGQAFNMELETQQGVNTFSIFANNTVGEGEILDLSVFTGDDVPLPPSNLRMEVRDGKAYLSWDAPTVGENGGYINPEELTYEIQRRSDFQYVEKNFAGTEYVDELPSNINSRPRQLFYCVRAKSHGGASLDTADSNRFITGEAEELPFSESFANQNYDDNHYWHSINDGERWNLQDVLVFDDDGGAAKFAPANVGENSLFYTSRLDLKGAEHPLVTFQYWHVKNSDMILEVQVSRENQPFETIRTFDFSENPEQSGWKKGAVLLDDYTDAEYVLVGWKATAGIITSITALDQVLIENVPAADLSVELGGPAKAAENQPVLFTAKISNNGAIDAENFKVIFAHENLGTIEERTIESLPIGKETVLEFSSPFHCTPGLTNGVYTASVVWDEDVNFANDKDRLVVTIRPGRLPKPEGLTGEVTSSSVILNWEAPRMSGEITDGAEDYDPFVISDFGDWITIDRDRQPTYRIVEGVLDEENEQISYITLEYANAGGEMAFQVFNPVKSGSSLAEGMTRTGDQMFASFAAVKEHNDDWMISPELSGDAQTISFFARSGGDQMWGLEKLEVWASDELQEPEKFTLLLPAVEIPTSDWKEIKVDLPEGTRHFAIRCVSEIVMVLFIDDITFTPKDAEATLIGYNVLRDGVKINDTIIPSTSFTDNDPAENASYRIEAVYKEGTSHPTSPLSTAQMGLGGGSEIAVAPTATIRVEGTTISAHGEGDITLEIHTLLGEQVAAVSGNGVASVTLAPGLYIARSGSIVRKLII